MVDGNVSTEDYRERGEAILRSAGRGPDEDPLLTAAPVPPDTPPPFPTEPVVPDHTRSQSPEGPTEPPKAPRKGFSLGTNKRRGSGVRALTAKDRDKIVGLYVTVGFGVMMFRPPTAQVIATQAEPCADAWMELARENDGVRRALLFMIEGGAWGAVVVAHMPIVFAVLPEEFGKAYSFLTPKIPDTPEGDGHVE
jgi:hypothetical protein